MPSLQASSSGHILLKKACLASKREQLKSAFLCIKSFLHVLTCVVTMILVTGKCRLWDKLSLL